MAKRAMKRTMLRLVSMIESTLMLLKPRMKKLAKINTKKNPTQTKKIKTRKKTTVMRLMSRKRAVLMTPVPMTKKVETIKKRPRDQEVLKPMLILNKFKLIKSSKMTKEKVVMSIEVAGTIEAIIEVTTGAVEATTVETIEVTTEEIIVVITEAVVVIIEEAVVTTEVVITDIKIGHMTEKVALRRLKVLKVELIKNNINNNSK